MILSAENKRMVGGLMGVEKMKQYEEFVEEVIR